jgi:NAD(P)H-dependent FMN reductase
MTIAPPTIAATDGAGPLTLGILIGSTRKGRVGAVVTEWFMTQAGQRELKIDVIDVATLGLSLDLARTAAVKDYTARIGAADAFVVVTPEYNHGYPAGLKLAIDSVRSEWAAKPVGFVSYGGLSGGLRAVEQLRQVFAEVHAVSIRDTVSFHQVSQCFDDAGELREPATAEAAATLLLDSLAWWAEALRAARDRVPYPS